jgi:hypothetical protein
MKYYFPLLICLFSSFAQAEKCTTAELVRLDVITNCAKQGVKPRSIFLDKFTFRGRTPQRTTRQLSSG